MSHAAGIFIVAPPRGRLLMLRRSPLVSSPNVWALPAGRMDPGESPVETALRELREETGYVGPILVRDEGYVMQNPKGLFHCIFGAVPREFTPNLNWENAACGWFSLRALPQPLHPGFAQFVAAHRDDLLQHCSVAR